MPPTKPNCLLITAAAAAALASGCASEGGTSLLSLAAAPKLELPKIAPGDMTTAEGTATEVYTRIARGALTCWFGASGPLKGPYIYFADADPPSKGGKAEIAVRTRDKDAADPRSLRAFAVDIAPTPEGTRVEVENLKIDPVLGDRLKADVFRWSAKEEGCSEAPVTAGWAAAPALTPVTAKSAPGTPKTKPAPPLR